MITSTGLRKKPCRAHSHSRTKASTKAAESGSTLPGRQLREEGTLRPAPSEETSTALPGHAVAVDGPPKQAQDAPDLESPAAPPHRPSQLDMSEWIWKDVQRRFTEH